MCRLDLDLFRFSCSFGTVIELNGLKKYFYLDKDDSRC